MWSRQLSWPLIVSKKRPRRNTTESRIVENANYKGVKTSNLACRFSRACSLLCYAQQIYKNRFLQGNKELVEPSSQVLAVYRTRQVSHKGTPAGSCRCISAESLHLARLLERREPRASRSAEAFKVEWREESCRAKVLCGVNTSVKLVR